VKTHKTVVNTGQWRIRDHGTYFTVSRARYSAMTWELLCVCSTVDQAREYFKANRK